MYLLLYDRLSCCVFRPHSPGRLSAGSVCLSRLPAGCATDIKPTDDKGHFYEHSSHLLVFVYMYGSGCLCICIITITCVMHYPWYTGGASPTFWRRRHPAGDPQNIKNVTQVDIFNVKGKNIRFYAWKLVLNRPSTRKHQISAEFWIRRYILKFWTTKTPKIVILVTPPVTCSNTHSCKKSSKAVKNHTTHPYWEGGGGSNKSLGLWRGAWP